MIQEYSSSIAGLMRGSSSLPFGPLVRLTARTMVRFSLRVVWRSLMRSLYVLSMSMSSFGSRDSRAVNLISDSIVSRIFQ